MRVNVRVWLALIFLCVAGALIAWLGAFKKAPTKTVAWATNASTVVLPAPPTQLASVAAANLAPSPSTNGFATNRAKYQLSNVSNPLNSLLRVDSAILMRNALIDTRSAVDLAIPENLRAGEEPGAYIIQAKGATTAAFQRMLRDAGAEIVSYIPNNAFLVKADSGTAQVLREQASVQAALAYEPYYKIDTRLMKHVIDNEPLSEDSWLRVTLFPGTEGQGLSQTTARIGAKERSPFGDQYLVQPRADMLAAMAQLPEVEAIEPFNPRQPANDLTRTRLGVSTNTTTKSNFLDLDGGANTWVNLNDFGVDSTHPALQGRVFYQGNNAKTDADGHGTHIAGTIIGSSNTNIFDHLNSVSNLLRFSTNVVRLDDGTTQTNVYLDGSLTNADFRGIAPKAKLFILPIDFNPDVNTPVTDTYLIETAAATNYNTFHRTNTLISNNSWNYANSTDYDTQAARYDQATRDALPDQTGEQPVLYVFAAGNEGFGDDDGQGGEPSRIASPGTAKNVITVGALESLRYIAEGLTNITETVEDDGEGNTTTNRTTNVVQIFLPNTDSDDQVASYSSRGNAGIAIESGYGRFKPDVVAPGTFIMSARSKQWKLENDFSPTNPDTAGYYTVLSNLNAVSSLYRYDSGTSFAAGGVSGLLALVQEYFSEIAATAKQRNMSPALMKALLINRSQSVHTRYDFNVQSRVNYQGWGLPTLTSLLSTNLEKFEEKDWPLIMVDQSPTNAIATGEERDFKLLLSTNATAFGLKITLVWTDPPGNPSAGKKLVNDLDLIVEAPDAGVYLVGNDILGGRNFTETHDPNADGAPETHTDVINNVENVFIEVPRGLAGTSKDGVNLNIRVVGRKVNVKSVNDFWAASTDSIDKNRRTNDIVQDFALVISSDQSRSTNGVFKSFTRQDAVGTFNPAPTPTAMVNGVELTNEVAGANSAMYWTNGNKVQWRFYKFENKIDPNGILKAGENVAFITAAPLNVSTPRNLEPDIDMYVSKDPKLLDLDTNVLATAWKSTGAGGTEQIVFTKDRTIPGTTDLADVYPTPGGVIPGVAQLNDTFYVAIKSEDQKAGDYSLIVISTDRPFEEDRDGVRIIHMFAPGAIPDGTANHPMGHRMFGVGVRGGRVLEAGSYIALTHEEIGDLVGTITHNNTHVTLNSHNLNNGDYAGTNAFIFSDSYYEKRTWPRTDPEYKDTTANGGFSYDAYGAPQYLFSDGPGLLASFAGAQIPGTWMLDMIDSAATHVGAVLQAEMHVKPLQPPLLNGQKVLGSVDPAGAQFFLVDVPPNAVKLTLILDQIIKDKGLIMLVRRDFVPSTNVNDFDYQTNVVVGSTNATLVIDANSKPPLVPGEYFIVLLNPGAVKEDFGLTALVEIGSFGANLDFIGASGISLKDNARTSSTKFFSEDSIVTDAAVAIVSKNARVSDLSFRLTSPQGTSLLLAENRGFNVLNNGFGSDVPTVNFTGLAYAVFNDHLGLPVKFKLPPFGDSDPQRGPVVGAGTSFESTLSRVYLVNENIEGWLVTTNQVSVVAGDAEAGQNYLNLGKGAISRSLPTVNGRPYRFSFSYRGQPRYTRIFQTGNTDWMNQPALGAVFSTGQETVYSNAQGVHTNSANGTQDRHYHIINNPDLNFPPAPGESGTALFVADRNAPPFPGWFANDTNSQWLAMSVSGDNNHPPGVYTNRTSFVLLDDPKQYRVNVRLAADETVLDILVNGVSKGGAVASPAGYSAPFVLDGPFNLDLNTIDFVVANSSSSAEGFRAQMSLAKIPTFTITDSSQLVTNGPTVSYLRLEGLSFTNFESVVGAPEWRRYSFDFIADKDNMLAEFFNGDLAGVDIDDIQLEDTGTTFLLPEEPLGLLNGERAMGDWTLEAWDNRTGMTVPAEIVDWELILSDVRSPRVAEALAPDRRYPLVINNPIINADKTNYTPGVLVRGEVEYFYIDVCDTASSLSISLFATNGNTSAVQMFADWSGFPTGNPETDDYVPLTTTANTNSIVTLALTTNSPASSPLRPGKRLYLTVANFNRFRTNNFIIRVLPNGCAFTPPQPLILGQLLQDYSFPGSTDDPGNAYTAQTSGAASVNLAMGGPGNLTLIAAKGFDPTPQNYQVKVNATSGNATLALPSGGAWYLRLLNDGGTTVPVTLSLTSSSSGFAIHSVAINSGHLKVSWESTAGKSYEISTSTDLKTWTVLTTVTATGAETTYTDPTSVGGTARFLRIRPTQ